MQGQGSWPKDVAKSGRPGPADSQTLIQLGQLEVLRIVAKLPTHMIGSLPERHQIKGRTAHGAPLFFHPLCDAQCKYQYISLIMYYIFVQSI